MENSTLTTPIVRILIFLGGVIAVYIIIKQIRYSIRRKYLMRKYSDVELINRLMSRMFWQGMSSELLIDSLGKPEDVDTKVLKTKTKEIWKYGRTGKNRYNLRITIENDVVIGWDKK